MRPFSLLLMVMLLAGAANAQQSVTGSVLDTGGKKPLSNAVVSLIRQKDSTLFQFSRTDRDGRFHFQSVPEGKYTMLVTYPRFADYADAVEVKAGSNDLGKVPLTLKAKLMDAVVIRSAGSIRIKGDTTEFVADSFHVREGATVEELLKKLPGFQVNSKGEVTAQGQRVQKVLVDGEEFFGDDPTAATKNISAKAVDKVQLFDNKTDQQNLTGITSGSEGKTVNIKLKEDQKKGSFGKAEVGSDFDKIVDARILLNRFVGKRKFSLYGTKSNTSTGSLNWEDRRKLGIENDFEYDEISGYYFSFGTADDFSEWSLRGLPNSYSTGALYIDKWNEDHHGVNTSYRFNRLETTNVGSKFEQNTLKDGDLLYVKTNSNSYGLNQQHAINGKYEWKVDSLTSFKYTVAGTHKDVTGASNLSSLTTHEQNDTRIENVSSKTNHSLRKQIDNQLQYKQLFNKKNRMLIATVRYGLIDDTQDAMIYSDLDYYTGTVKDSNRLQDQQKIGSGNSATYGGKLTFSEPVGTKWNLITEYSFNKNNSVSHRNTFEKSPNGKYESLNDDFSNNFEFDATSHTGTVYAKYNYKKLRMSVGSGISSIRLNLLNLDISKRNTYNFLNATPQLSLGYSPRPQATIGVNYRGTTRQPTIDQLQPIRNNEDQLNEFVGNPDLRVGFNHNISLFYNSYKVLSARGIWLNAGINFTEDAITQSSTINAVGKRTFKPVNVNGNYNWYMWSEWNKGEGEKKLNHRIGLSANGGRNVSFVNGELNTTNFYTATLEYGINYEAEEKYRIHIQPKLGYNSSVSSFNKNIDNNYWNYGGEVEGYLMLPLKLEITTSVDMDLRQRIENFSGNPNVTIWNASIYRKVFKNKSGKIIFSANDILDQNRGFTRDFSSYRRFEENYQRISQYFMLKFEWSFTQMGGQK